MPSPSGQTPNIPEVPDSSATSADEIADRLLNLETDTERQRFLKGHQPKLSVDVVERLKGAVDYFIRTDIQRALRIAETARKTAAFIENPLADAVSLRALAEAHHASSRYPDALHSYEQASRIYNRLERPVEAARISRNMIDVLMYMGRYQKALAVAQRTRDIFVNHGQQSLAAQVDTHIGNIYYRMDDAVTALRFYDQAQAIFEAYEDPFARALIEYNRANALAVLNDFQTAEKLYRRARELYQRRQFNILAADVDYALAYLCFLRSRFFEALSILDEAKELYLSGRDESGAAFCDQDRSEVFLRINLPEEAKTSAEHARATFSRLGMRYDEAKATAHLAAAQWRLNRIHESLSHFEKAESLFQAEGNALQVASTSICRAELRLAQGDAMGASEIAREAIVIFKASAAIDRLCDAYLCLAQAQRYQGFTEESWEAAEQALKALDDRDRPWLRYRCHFILGQVLTDRLQHGAAEQHFDRSLDELERMWRDLRVDNYRVAFLHDKSSVYAQAVRLKLAIGGEGALGAAFTCTERGRSRSIVEMLARHSLLVPPKNRGVAPEVYERFSRLQEELNWFYNRIGRRDIADSDRTKSIEDDRFREDVNQRERELGELRKTLRDQDEEFSDIHGFFSVKLEDVQSHLTASEVMLSYFVADEELMVFVVKQDQAFVRRCPVTLTALSRQVEGLRFQLTKFLYGPSYVRSHRHQLQRSVDRYLRSLYQNLLAPISEHFEDRDLIVIPHGLLHYIPFHALLDRDTYVVEKRAVSYAPSAHVYCLAQERGRHPQPRRSQGSSPSLVALGTADPSAPFMAEEARLVSQVFKGSQLHLGDEVTRDVLARSCAKARIVHLATHAEFRSDNPMLSSLQLADGPLDVHAIYNFEASAELVTLSGCETGVNQVASGDELLGLIRGFLYAGAQSLLVSLWSVGDQSTAHLMETFYRKLKGGARPRQAIREAQIAMMETYEHPFYWAPFLISGKA